MDKMTNVKALQFVLDTATMPTDVREKLTALHASLAKKSAGNHKPTAKQTENEAIKATIVNAMEPKRLYSIGEIAKEILGEAYTTQKVSALMSQLAKVGVVERTEEKRKPYFTVVEFPVDEDEDAIQG